MEYDDIKMKPRRRRRRRSSSSSSMFFSLNQNPRSVFVSTNPKFKFLMRTMNLAENFARESVFGTLLNVRKCTTNNKAGNYKL